MQKYISKINVNNFLHLYCYHMVNICNKQSAINLFEITCWHQSSTTRSNNQTRTKMNQSLCAGGKVATRSAPRPSYSLWPETMCFQSDASSNLALYALKDLQDAGRLKVPVNEILSSLLLFQLSISTLLYIDILQ